MAEHGKYCPIMVAGGNMYVSQCIGKDCTWWLPYANDCALPVVNYIGFGCSVRRSG